MVSRVSVTFVGHHTYRTAPNFDSVHYGIVHVWHFSILSLLARPSDVKTVFLLGCPISRWWCVSSTFHSVSTFHGASTCQVLIILQSRKRLSRRRREAVARWGWEVLHDANHTSSCAVGLRGAPLNHAVNHTDANAAAAVDGVRSAQIHHRTGRRRETADAVASQES